ncbi:MAG: hypothetical protein ACXADY_02665 [Candidatus Hodarchaeales archaeon]
MDVKQYEKLITENEETLIRLNNKKVFLISNLLGGGLLQDKEILKQNAAAFSADSDRIITQLLNSEYIINYPYPVLIDLAKTIELYQSNTSLPENERIESSFLMSRINFMGTDGIRGKISLETDDYLKDLTTKNVLTPELIRNCVFSFANLLLHKKIIEENDTVCIGDDGRDRITNGKFKNALIDGFLGANIHVYDLGIVPTGIVPYQLLKKGFKAGAVLTASHNPSNQNGIKFFLNGRKLLPEGELGDFTLSAFIYYYYLHEILPERKASVSVSKNIVAESTDFILSVLPQNITVLLRDSIIIFDSANGAFTEIGINVMDTLQLDYTSVNDVPDGHNINKNCGVAELEGHDIFHAKSLDVHPRLIKETFSIGRKNDPGKVFGISLDGDGDRGYVVHYNKENDSVYVINGDKCGYILADYFLKSRKVEPKDFFFVLTIESDLMAASSVEKNLGLKTKIVSVGDKWIGNFDEGELLIGVETSGHLIFPIEFVTDSNQKVKLLTGNGLLTSLMVLAAIKELDLSTEKIFLPFKPGISETFYVFFIDKSRFYKGSTVWTKDIELINGEILRLIENKRVSSDTKLVLEEKEDPNVLYMNIVDANEVQGCIFVRNSGTEDKIATYTLGKQEIKDTLFKIGKKLRKNHILLMKDKNKLEFKYERHIEEFLQKQTEINIQELKDAMEQIVEHLINENDLYNVLYGLKKEGRIKFENHIVQLI